MDLGGFAATSVQKVQVIDKAGLVSTAVLSAIGGGTGVHEASYIVETDRLLTCCGDTVFCLSLPSLDLLWKTGMDLATCFGIYAFQDDYIVHGELAISRLDENGLILWQRGGADIFTTSEGGLFQLTKHCIIVEDWQNRVYKFDYLGNDVTGLHS